MISRMFIVIIIIISVDLIIIMCMFSCVFITGRGGGLDGRRPAAEPRVRGGNK